MNLFYDLTFSFLSSFSSSSTFFLIKLLYFFSCTFIPLSNNFYFTATTLMDQLAKIFNTIPSCLVPTHSTTATDGLKPRPLTLPIFSTTCIKASELMPIHILYVFDFQAFENLAPTVTTTSANKINGCCPMPIP